MKKEKVLVGLSGGVDSAVAAYLLKEQGYDVTCAFMRNWDAYANNDIKGNPTINDDVCPQEADFHDAQLVADKLELPLLRVDFVKEYWDNVFATFLKEYEKGRTPNPDILCNKYIKFASFFDFAMEKGFDKVATGHYARIKEDDNGKALMLKGLDNNKDQTYFLCQVSQEALNKTLFPIGDLEKSEVRKIANEQHLAVANKKDSTGVCFIGERNFKQFLSNYLPSKPGNIIDVDSGKVLGKHTGVLYYTVGQRKGLGIGGNGGPWFVCGKDVMKNELYVCAHEDNPLLYSNRAIINEINWYGEKKPTEFIALNAKFRYRQKDNPIKLRFIDENKVELSYPQKVSSVTCGQEAVFYDGERCLGGGVIDEVFIDDENLQERIKEIVNEKRN